MNKFLAVRPFTEHFGGFVRDANGSLVVTCFDDHICELYASRELDALENAHFTCPYCGRLGQRMEEAKMWQCREETK